MNYSYIGEQKDDWIYWHGNQPLPSHLYGMKIQMLLRNGITLTGLTEWFRWDHWNLDSDIVAYKGL